MDRKIKEELKILGKVMTTVMVVYLLICLAYWWGQC